MAYDPYQYAAARGSIVGGAMQTVGNLASQMAMALGEIGQQKIDMRKLANEDYPKLLATATDVFEKEYGIPKAKAAALASRTFLSPTNFKDPKEAKATWLQQTGRLDEIGSAYSQTLQKQTEKARTETAQKNVQGIISATQGQVPAGSAVNQIPTTQPTGTQPPMLPPVGGATAQGPQWTGAEREPQAAPESLFSQAPAQAPTAPAGSAAAELPTQESMMRKMPGREERIALSTDPIYQTYPKEQTESDKLLGKLKIATETAKLRESLGNKPTSTRTIGGRRATGEITESDEISILKGNRDFWEKNADQLQTQLTSVDDKIHDIRAETAGVKLAENPTLDALEQQRKTIAKDLKDAQRSRDYAHNKYADAARAMGIDVDYITRIPEGDLQRAADLVAASRNPNIATGGPGVDPEKERLGYLVQNVAGEIKAKTGLSMNADTIADMLSRLMDEQLMTEEEAVAAFIDKVISARSGQRFPQTGE